MSGHEHDPTAAIIGAIEANLSALWRSYSQLPGAELVDQPEIMWIATDIPFPPFNGVLRANLQSETSAQMITSTLQQFDRHQVPMLWLVGPASAPADLGAQLIAHGLTQVGDDPGMALDLQRLPSELPVPAGFTSAAVHDHDTLRAWCSFTDQASLSDALFAWGCTLGFAPDRAIIHFLGHLDGRPVATATLVLGSGVAGIYNVMTIPEAQRRGIGALMTVRALEYARARGYNWGVLQSSKLGEPLYRRLGFEEYCRIGIYFWKG